MAVRPGIELPHEDAVEDREMVDRRERPRVDRQPVPWRQILFVWIAIAFSTACFLQGDRNPLLRALDRLIENAWGWYVGVCIAFGLGGVLLLGAVYGRKR